MRVSLPFGVKYPLKYALLQNTTIYFHEVREKIHLELKITLIPIAFNFFLYDQRGMPFKMCTLHFEDSHISTEDTGRSSIWATYGQTDLRMDSPLDADLRSVLCLRLSRLQLGLG